MTQFPTQTTKPTENMTLPPGLTGLERIILTCNGNLQRVFAAYFNHPVTLSVVSSSTIDSITNRLVEIHVKDKLICTATSIISITDLKYSNVSTKGIGQLFQSFNIQPEFILNSVGSNETMFWRRYVLRHQGISCEIKEVFPNNVFDLEFKDDLQSEMDKIRAQERLEEELDQEDPSFT